MESYKKVVDIFSTIFRLVGILIYFNIGIYLQIFFTNNILIRNCDQGVKNIIHIWICIICLLQKIFIFLHVHQKNDSVHAAIG